MYRILLLIIPLTLHSQTLPPPPPPIATSGEYITVEQLQVDVCLLKPEVLIKSRDTGTGDTINIVARRYVRGKYRTLEVWEEKRVIYAFTECGKIVRLKIWEEI